MARFVIEKVQPNDNVPPDVPGLRQTVNLPDYPPAVKNWTGLIKWFAENPDVPHDFHIAIVTLFFAFQPQPNPH